MGSPAFTITAPCRLHFGMFSFGVPALRQFGGVGVMIDRPNVTISADRGRPPGFVGRNADRLQAAVEAVQATDWGRALPTDIGYTIDGPRSHTGLGSGTQTALSVVALARHILHLPPLDAGQLAALTGRAKRSAVGLHGFLHGGLIVEAGKLPHETVSPLTAQVDLPQKWRIVLICPREQEGLSGESERVAFEKMPPVPRPLTDELSGIAHSDLVPAARNADFAGFADAVYRFGVAAGQCFKSHQAGIYATEELAAIVSRVRAMGVVGVGQSSWGPTLFTLHPSAGAAAQFTADCRSWPGADRYEFTTAAPNRGGARIESTD